MRDPPPKKNSMTNMSYDKTILVSLVGLVKTKTVESLKNVDFLEPSNTSNSDLLTDNENYNS